jgi:hypothetical protein
VKRGFDDVGCNPAFGAAIQVEFRTDCSLSFKISESNLEFVNFRVQFQLE